MIRSASHSQPGSCQKGWYPIPARSTSGHSQPGSSQMKAMLLYKKITKDLSYLLTSFLSNHLLKKVQSIDLASVHSKHPIVKHEDFNSTILANQSLSKAW